MTIERCSCPEDTKFCEKYNLSVTRREHSFLRGTSELPQEKEEAYVASLLGRELPPLLTQATNLAGAVVRHALGGFRKATPAEAESRLEICFQCDRWNKDRENPRCLVIECGCFLREKTSWANESCPLGKWPALIAKRGGGCGCGVVSQ